MDLGEKLAEFASAGKAVASVANAFREGRGVPYWEAQSAHGQLERASGGGLLRERRRKQALKALFDAQWAHVRQNPSRKGSKSPKISPVTGKPYSEVYATTFCNRGHYMATGRPIGHECRIIPPAALRAEYDGDIARAQEILSRTPPRWVRGRPARKNPTDMTVANTILSQMGGARRVQAMTGAKNFIGGENSLSFQFPQPDRSRPNAVRVTLEPNDFYKVEFYRYKVGGHLRLLETHQDIGAEQLKPLFEHVTGLRLSL
jgi:hypothetical protein